MTVFAFVIILVAIVTIGKIITERQSGPFLPPANSPPPEEILHLQESIGQLGVRLEKLEEERDFYRALLDPPDKTATLPPNFGEQAPSVEEPEK